MCASASLAGTSCTGGAIILRLDTNLAIQDSAIRTYNSLRTRINSHGFERLRVSSSARTVPVARSPS